MWVEIEHIQGQNKINWFGYKLIQNDEHRGKS